MLKSSASAEPSRRTASYYTLVIDRCWNHRRLLGGLMRIPGKRRDLQPDECGVRAGQFAEAVRNNDMLTAWSMLSKESQGVRQGVWATEKNIDLQIIYRAAHDPQHPMFPFMMEDFRTAILKLWPLEDLTDLGVAPTSYIDDNRAFAFLPFGVTNDQQVMSKSTLMSGLIIPMVFEDGGWSLDLPGWRFV